MHYLIGHALNKNMEMGEVSAGTPCGSDRGVNYGLHTDSTIARSLRDTSLPWEILEAANSLFQKKGYEKTSIADICRRLEIKPFEFHTHFDSLDEVLEILWER